MQIVLRNTILFVAVLGIGLIAGIFLGSGMEDYTAKALPESAWTLRFQLEDALFSKAMPPIMLTTLATLFAASSLVPGRSRFLFGVATLLMVIVLIITVKFEVPLNKQIQTWTAGSAPADWALVRDRWLWNHMVRTICGIASFGCALCGLVLL